MKVGLAESRHIFGVDFPFPWRRPEIQSQVVSRPNADGRAPGPSWSRGDLHPRSRVCKRSTPIPNAGNAPGTRDSARAPRLSSAGAKVVAQTPVCREEILFWKSAFPYLHASRRGGLKLCDVTFSERRTHKPIGNHGDVYQNLTRGLFPLLPVLFTTGSLPNEPRKVP